MMKKGGGRHSQNFDNVLYTESFLRLQAYWKRLVVLAVVVICGASLYFIKTLPPLSSNMMLQVGFKSINNGRYPDGSVFNKNDFISHDILKKSYADVGSVMRLDNLSFPLFENSFFVEGVYPLDVQVAKKSLSKTENLKPDEVLANYNKVAHATPSIYMVHFSPPVPLGQKEHEWLLDAVVRNYVDYVNTMRLPASWNGAKLNDVSQAELSPVVRYEQLRDQYDSFMAFIQQVDDQKHSLDVEKKSGDAGIVPEQSFALGAPAARSTHVAMPSIVLTEFLQAEHLIYDLKALEDPAMLVSRINSEIAALDAEIAQLDKKAAFRIRLAELPGTLYGEAPDSSSAPGDKKMDNTMLGLLLTYTPQYYSLLDAAQNLFDRKLALEKRRETLKMRMARLIAAKEPGEGKPALMADLGIVLQKLQQAMDKVMQQSDAVIKSDYQKFEPAVRDYTTVFSVPQFPIAKVLMVTVISVVFGALLQYLFILLSLLKEKERTQSDAVPISIAQRTDRKD